MAVTTDGDAQVRRSTTSPIRRPQARTLVLLLLTLGIMLPVGMTSASAAPGAIGGFAHGYEAPYGRVFCNSSRCVVDNVDGWAYNKNTVPVQAVQIHFYSAKNALLHVSGQYIANQFNQYVPVKYANFGWSYYTGSLSPSFGGIRSWAKACAWAHDKGESGGYVFIGCEPIYQYVG